MWQPVHNGSPYIIIWRVILQLLHIVLVHSLVFPFPYDFIICDRNKKIKQLQVQIEPVFHVKDEKPQHSPARAFCGLTSISVPAVIFILIPKFPIPQRFRFFPVLIQAVHDIKPLSFCQVYGLLPDLLRLVHQDR